MEGIEANTCRAEDRTNNNHLARPFALDIHEIPIKLPQEHTHLMWHVNSEYDAGHRWLRESMMQAALTN